MKLSTRIKKYVNPTVLWDPHGGYGNDILNAGHQIVLVVDHDKENALRTYSLDMADEYHRHLTNDEHCTLLPLNECPVVNDTEIVMHYTRTTYRNWCNL